MNIIDQEKLKEIIANPQTENERLLVDRLDREKQYDEMAGHIFDGLDGLSGWKGEMSDLLEALDKFIKATRKDWQEEAFNGEENPEYIERIACIWDYVEGNNPDWRAMFEDIGNAFDACDKIFETMPEEI